MASREGNLKIRQKLIEKHGSYEAYVEYMRSIGTRGGKPKVPKGTAKRNKTGGKDEQKTNAGRPRGSAMSDIYFSPNYVAVPEIVLFSAVQHILPKFDTEISKIIAKAVVEAAPSCSIDGLNYLRDCIIAELPLMTHPNSKYWTLALHAIYNTLEALGVKDD